MPTDGCVGGIIPLSSSASETIVLSPLPSLSSVLVPEDLSSSLSLLLDFRLVEELDDDPEPDVLLDFDASLLDEVLVVLVLLELESLDAVLSLDFRFVPPTEWLFLVRFLRNHLCCR